MDAFKAWPGRAESIVISQESYMRCTGGVAPRRRDGDKGPSYYAVCVFSQVGVSCFVTNFFRFSA